MAQPLDSGNDAPVRAARPRVCRNNQMTIAMFTMFQPIPLNS
jgi:hypothetical protein